MTRKFFLTYCFIFLLTGAAQRQAWAALPEIEGWACGELRVTTLDTVSGNKGSWEERSYRTPGGERYHAVWIEGAAEKGWQPADEAVNENEGLLPSGAIYKRVEIAGQKAVFEDQPIVGKSLTIKIANRGTLTLETQNADETALLAAGRLLTATLLK